MKTYNEKNNDPEFEDDPVWNLIDQASTSVPSATFLQDTLRRVRIEGQVTASWWQKLFSPKPLIISAAAACAAVTILISLKSDPTSAPVITATPPPSEDLVELEDALANELLVIASEDPTLFSDEEILALLF